MGKEKIAVVYCEHLVWNEELGETYCFLGKLCYPKGCGLACLSWKKSEDWTNVRH